jgi:NhaA family Na+:H+ antiporter
MALFFGLAAKEITEACLPGGALNPPKKAINPLLGTVGGVVGPIAVYFAWVAFTGDATIAGGWGIPTATDIALAWLVARMVFGGSHPAVSFLLLLAVADDGIGLGIIAIFYPDPAHPVQPIYLGLVALAMVGAYLLRRRATASFWPYLLLPGVVSWFGLFYAHLHPALALVPIVPFMPSKGFDVGMYAEEAAVVQYTDTLDQFAHTFRTFVTFGLFGFGLVNAGVVLSSIGNATWGVLLSLAVGKTFGVFLFAVLGDRLGFPLPNGMNYRSLFVAGLTASLGLTVALFVAGVAFTDPTLQGAAKMGALMSGGMTVVILFASRVFKIVRVESA